MTFLFISIANRRLLHVCRRRFYSAKRAEQSEMRQIESYQHKQRERKLYYKYWLYLSVSCSVCVCVYECAEWRVWFALISVNDDRGTLKLILI